LDKQKGRVSKNKGGGGGKRKKKRPCCVRPLSSLLGNRAKRCSGEVGISLSGHRGKEGGSREGVYFKQNLGRSTKEKKKKKFRK